LPDDRDSPLSILLLRQHFSAFIDRENLTAFKGNDAAKRFVDELNRAEDALQNARKQSAFWSSRRTPPSTSSTS